ncbi:MAG: YicC/YloC family endoribonuclease [bacterium]
MVYSMTGTGEGRVSENGFDVSIFIKSINHRFFNLQIRMPRGYQRYETIVRDMVVQKIGRGKLDIMVEFYSLPEGGDEFVAHYGHAEKVADFIERLADNLDIPSGLTAEKLLHFGDMFSTLPPSSLDDFLVSIIQKACEQAIRELLESRHVEGIQLSKDVLYRIDEIDRSTKKIRLHAENQPKIVRERLQDAIQRLDAEKHVTEERLEEEVLMWAIRSDITEEITRIESHLKRLRDLFEVGRNVGKELEFLAQELHREITTIGSKSVVKEINSLIVPIKMEIEKLREQAQNLE